MARLLSCLLLSASLYASEQGMQWDDNSIHEDGFNIYRSIGNGSFVKIGSVGKDVTKFTDRDVPVGKRVSYQVKAFNKWGEGLPSNILTIGSEVPKAPSKLRKPDEDS